MMPLTREAAIDSAYRLRELAGAFDREHEELRALRARVASAVACLPRRPDAALAILRGEETR